MADALFRLALPDGSTRLAAGSADAGPQRLLSAGLTIDGLLAGPPSALGDAVATAGEPVGPDVAVLAPVENQEVWAAGVTYLRSRDARIAESRDADPYTRVYDAQRPEVFFKAAGWRVRGPGQEIGVRRDSSWSAPEPELALVLTAGGAVAGYAIGNDVSSRSIEGDNPLYLPQAKIYEGSCALGPGIVPAAGAAPPFAIEVTITRGGEVLYRDATTTAQMRRTFDELVACLFAAMPHPAGAVLLTGTSLIPPDDVSLAEGDRVDIAIAGLGTLSNPVAAVGRV
jgi:2-dehydro-3-deoxy-D-arabinonate dehydratase